MQWKTQKAEYKYRDRLGRLGYINGNLLTIDKLNKLIEQGQ